jgi:hypothetical protein
VFEEENIESVFGNIDGGRINSIKPKRRQENVRFQPINVYFCSSHRFKFSGTVTVPITATAMIDQTICFFIVRSEIDAENV